VGQHPTERGKIGTNRSVLPNIDGVSLSLAVEGVNRHDFKMIKETITRSPVERPMPALEQPVGRCLDNGNDDNEVGELLAKCEFTAQIRAQSEEA
jgi:hypothetical protein